MENVGGNLVNLNGLGFRFYGLGFRLSLHVNPDEGALRSQACTKVPETYGTVTGARGFTVWCSGFRVEDLRRILKFGAAILSRYRPYPVRVSKQFCCRQPQPFSLLSIYGNPCPKP